MGAVWAGRVHRAREQGPAAGVKRRARPKPRAPYLLPEESAGIAVGVDGAKQNRVGARQRPGPTAGAPARPPAPAARPLTTACWVPVVRCAWWVSRHVACRSLRAGRGRRRHSSQGELPAEGGQLPSGPAAALLVRVCPASSARSEMRCAHLGSWGAPSESGRLAAGQGLPAAALPGPPGPRCALLAAAGQSAQ